MKTEGKYLNHDRLDHIRRSWGTEAVEQYGTPLSCRMGEKDLDKYRGCLIGGAVGDALGYAVEFSSEAVIFRKYGSEGIREYDLVHGAGQISDDTQMTLFTANGMMIGMSRGRIRGSMGPMESYIEEAYREWYRTQTERYPLKKEENFCWLCSLPVLFENRAPGGTCMGALSEEKLGSLRLPLNHSKGCGGVMRVAPIGLYPSDPAIPILRTDLLGADAAVLTHGHELGYIPAAMLVHIVRLLSHSKDITLLEAVRDGQEAMKKLFPETAHLNEFLALIDRAVELSQQDMPDLEAIHQLGEGWVAEETLAIAVYCALKYEHDFEKAICAAVNHRGDSDSTGAVTGNILGAYLGLSAVPGKYLETLELRDVILEIAEDLYDDCKISEDRKPETEKEVAWFDKYVYGTYGQENRK